MITVNFVITATCYAGFCGSCGQALNDDSDSATGEIGMSLGGQTPEPSQHHMLCIRLCSYTEQVRC